MMAASPGGFPQSNAAKSKAAREATANALAASKESKQGDHESHGRAAAAHFNAAYRQRAAGNASKADAHEQQARVHQEKASAGQKAKGFADDLSRDANELTKKAALAAYGKDEKDPRSEKQLHQDAAEAHDRASKAHEMAGQGREQKFHADQAAVHQNIGC